MRILKGLIFLAFALFSAMVFPTAENQQFFAGIEHFMMQGFGNTIGSKLSLITEGLFYFYWIAAFLKGVYYLVTWQQKNPIFEHNVPFWVKGTEVEPDYKNISKVLAYRESRLTGLPQDKASSEYLKTAWLDGAVNKGKSRQVLKSLKFLESKLSGMSAAEGYEYIKNHGK